MKKTQAKIILSETKKMQLYLRAVLRELDRAYQDVEEYLLEEVPSIRRKRIPVMNGLKLEYRDIGKICCLEPLREQLDIMREDLEILGGDE